MQIYSIPARLVTAQANNYVQGARNVTPPERENRGVLLKHVYLYDATSPLRKDYIVRTYALQDSRDPSVLRWTFLVIAYYGGSVDADGRPATRRSNIVQYVSPLCDADSASMSRYIERALTTADDVVVAKVNSSSSNYHEEARVTYPISQSVACWTVPIFYGSPQHPHEHLPVARPARSNPVADQLPNGISQFISGTRSLYRCDRCRSLFDNLSTARAHLAAMHRTQPTAQPDQQRPAPVVAPKPRVKTPEEIAQEKDVADRKVLAEWLDNMEKGGSFSEHILHSLALSLGQHPDYVNKYNKEISDILNKTPSEFVHKILNIPHDVLTKLSLSPDITSQINDIHAAVAAPAPRIRKFFNAKHYVKT